MKAGSDFDDSKNRRDNVEVDLEHDSLKYLKRELNPSEHSQFVSRLETDPNLRQLIRNLRANTLEGDLPTLSEEVCSLAARLHWGISNGNHIFPGNSYIAGLENRPGMTDQRNSCYENARAAALELIKLGYLEDLAFETIAIANANIQRGVEAARCFGSYDRADLSGIFIAFGGQVQQRSNIPCPLPPVSLEFASPVHQGVVARLAAGIESDRARRELLGELWEQFPSYARKEEGYRYFYADRTSAKIGPVETQLIALFDKDETLKAMATSRLSSPIHGTQADKEIASRLVVARVLIEAAVQQSNFEQIKPVLSLYFDMAGDLGNDSLTKNRIQYFVGLGHLLFSRANSNEHLWANLKPSLLTQLESARLQHQIEHFSSSTPEILEFLSYARARIFAEPDLREAILSRREQAYGTTAAYETERGDSYDMLSEEKEFARLEAIGVIGGVQSLIPHFPPQERAKLQIETLRDPSSMCAAHALRDLRYLKECTRPNEKGEPPSISKLPETYDVAAITKACQERLLGREHVEAKATRRRFSREGRWEEESFNLLLEVNPSAAAKALQRIVRACSYGRHETDTIWNNVTSHIKDESLKKELLLTVLLSDDGWKGPSNKDGERLEELAKLGVSTSQIVDRLLAMKETWSEGVLDLVSRLGDPRCGERLVKMGCDEKISYRLQVIALRELRRGNCSSELKDTDIAMLAKQVLDRKVASIGDFERQVSLGEETSRTLRALASNVSFSMTVEALTVVRNEILEGHTDIYLAKIALAKIDKCLAAIRTVPNTSNTELSPPAAYVYFISRGIHQQLVDHYLRIVDKSTNLTPDDTATKASVEHILGLEHVKPLREYILEHKLNTDNKLRETVTGLMRSVSEEYIPETNSSSLADRLELLSIGLLVCREQVAADTTAHKLFTEELMKRGESILAAKEHTLFFDKRDIPIFAACYIQCGRFKVAEKILGSQSGLLEPEAASFLIGTAQDTSFSEKNQFIRFVRERTGRSS